MKLHEWEVWHTYSTFMEPVPDLDRAAEILVEKGLAECVVHRDGNAYWQADDGVARGGTTVRLHPRLSGAKIQLAPEEDPEGVGGFSLESWGQAAHFRFSELRVFGPDAEFPSPYIRAFLGKCYLRSEKGGIGIGCYPHLKLFESGVLLVEFRVIGPDEPIEVGDFIERYVNLFQTPFETVELAPAFVEHGSNAYYFGLRQRWPFHLRAGMAWLQREHRRAVQEHTRLEQEDPFEFQVAPLSREEGDEHDHTLAGVFLAIAGTVAYVLSKPREGIKLALLGQRKLLRWGGYWVGRPHIYLIDFDDQQETAVENESSHGDVFGRILARAPQSTGSDWRRFLPPDGRAFEDFGVYVNQAVSLWVWALSGIRQQEQWADANRGHLIYEHQAVIEVLEYGYMIHRSLYESVRSTGVQEEVIAGRRRLAQLRMQMAQPSHFGELKELLGYGWSTFGLPELRDRIDDLLGVTEAEASLRESRVAERVGQALTVAFGLLAVPPLASEVIAPAWQLLGWWVPQNEAAKGLFFVSISVVLVFLLVLFLIQRLSHTGSKNG